MAATRAMGLQAAFLEGRSPDPARREAVMRVTFPTATDADIHEAMAFGSAARATGARYQNYAARGFVPRGQHPLLPGGGIGQQHYAIVMVFQRPDGSVIERATSFSHSRAATMGRIGAHVADVADRMMRAGKSDLTEKDQLTGYRVDQAYRE